MSYPTLASFEDGRFVMKHLWLTIVFGGGFGLIFILTCLLIAISKGHQRGWPPRTISFLGHSKCTPESMFFAYGGMVSALHMFYVADILYYYQRVGFENHKTKLNIFLRSLSYFCMKFAAVGLGMVVCFHGDTYKGAHYVGAGLFFGLMTVYMVIYAYLFARYGIALDFSINKNLILSFRILITCLGIISGFIFGLSTGLNEINDIDHECAPSDTPTTNFVIIGRFCEWLSFACIMLYTFSFVMDIYDVSLELVKDNPYTDPTIDEPSLTIERSSSVWNEKTSQLEVIMWKS